MARALIAHYLVSFPHRQLSSFDWRGCPPARRVWVAMGLAAALQCMHLQASDASGTTVGTTEVHSSLLEKYTFRETVRTVIEEDQLPELPDFLESIGLGNRLEVCDHVCATVSHL